MNQHDRANNGKMVKPVSTHHTKTITIEIKVNHAHVLEIKFKSDQEKKRGVLVMLIESYIYSTKFFRFW